MRNITFILAIFFVLAGSIAFTYDNAEAARRYSNKRVCTCNGPNGTLYHGCPVHGNKCIGLPAHEHENTPNRSTLLPIVCEHDGVVFLVNAPSCKVVKNQIRKQERELKAMQREANAQQRAIERMRNKYQRNSAFHHFLNTLDREKRLAARRAGRDLGRDISRKIFGY